MNRDENQIKFLRRVLIYMFVLVCLLTGIITSAYAKVNTSPPEVIISIDDNGKVEQRGNLFGNELWYPGMVKSGVIRIENNRSGIKGIRVDGLSTNLKINKVHAGCSIEEVKNAFAKHMHMTIEKGKYFVFSERIIDNKALHDMSGSEYASMADSNITIEKNDSIDLKYELKMDEESGNELQDLSANLSFGIRLDSDNK